MKKEQRTVKKEQRTKKTEQRTKKTEQRTMKKQAGKKQETSWNKNFKERPRDGATLHFLVLVIIIEGATCTF